MGGLARVAGFWNALAGPSRRLIITAAIVFAGGLFLLMRLSGSAAYSNLVAGVTPQDAASVTSKLRDAGIAYKLADGGSTVKVPADKLDQARIDLAQTNLLGGGVGYELFDKQSLGATDFTQRVNLMRAREGELARAIGALEPVRTATVKLAMPEQRLFSSEQQPTTASIILDMELGQSLDASQVRGIVNLAANAVPGLTPSKVTVADSKGNILSGAGADQEVADVNNRLAAEAEWERRAQAKLDAMLVTLVGPGKAVSQVDVTLNMDKVTSQQETFDPKKSTPLDTSETTETYKGSGGGSGGVAGAGGNTPGAQYPATSGANGKSDYTKTTKTSRNGVDHTRIDTTKAGGDVEKLSVSVQVDESAGADIAKIEEAVVAAIGADEKGRKDQVSVQPVAFAKVDAKAAAAHGGGTTSTGAPSGGLDIMSLAKTALVGIGVLMLLLMTRKSLRRRQGELESVLPELLKRGPVPVAELTAGAGGVAPLEGQRKTPVQEQMEALA
ncbi:MAG: flagellar basal-body MS-ring/collar protein FliF, partial [Actinomycetota bacterium]